MSRYERCLLEDSCDKVGIFPDRVPANRTELKEIKGIGQGMANHNPYSTSDKKSFYKNKLNKSR